MPTISFSDIQFKTRSQKGSNPDVSNLKRKSRKLTILNAI